MKYALLDANSLTVLNLKVNEYLMKGWELYGSPTIGGANGYIYLQAVIFNDNKPTRKQL